MYCVHFEVCRGVEPRFVGVGNPARTLERDAEITADYVSRNVGYLQGAPPDLTFGHYA